MAPRGRHNGAPATVADYVTEQVLALIEREALGRGDRLPSVRQSVEGYLPRSSGIGEA